LTFCYSVDVLSPGSATVEALEKSFRERSLAFYRSHIKRIKKELGPRVRQPHHTVLKLRHEFKMSFYHEFCSPPNKILKHYVSTFKHLTALQPTMQNYGQLKGVGSLVTSKLCRFYFALVGLLFHPGFVGVTPSWDVCLLQHDYDSALLQFQLHMRHFHDMIGDTRLVCVTDARGRGCLFTL
jgi:hypothetical protein